VIILAHGAAQPSYTQGDAYNVRIRGVDGVSADEDGNIQGREIYRQCSEASRRWIAYLRRLEAADRQGD